MLLLLLREVTGTILAESNDSGAVVYTVDGIPADKVIVDAAVDALAGIKSPRSSYKLWKDSRPRSRKLVEATEVSTEVGDDSEIVVSGTGTEAANCSRLVVPASIPMLDISGGLLSPVPPPGPLPDEGSTAREE